MSQQQPPFGHPPEAPQGPARPRRAGAWPRRHPVWSTLIGIAAVLLAIAATQSATSSRAGRDPAADHHTASPTPQPSAIAAGHKAALRCHARAVHRRPRDHSMARIRVRTRARAWVSATTHSAVADPAPGRGGRHGIRILYIRVGDATPGTRVVFAVRVTRHGHTAACRASFRPRPVRARAVAAPTKPVTTPPAAPVPTPTPTPQPPTPTGCYPRTDAGHCYEPGEFCRDSDHGVTGVAGDGERIVCTDNNGWRWEPV
jgi:hypothetical protein